jgi:hypothetical protein
MHAYIHAQDSANLVAQHLEARLSDGLAAVLQTVVEQLDALLDLQALHVQLPRAHS